MTRQLVGIEPFPVHLDNMEWLIGDMPLFSSSEDAALARAAPGQLDRETLQHRHEIYANVLGEIATAYGIPEIEIASRPDALDEAWIDIHANADEFRTRHSRFIGDVRGRLMEADENLKTPAVKRLEEALADLPIRESVTRRIPHKDRLSNAVQLPAYATTLRSVGRIIDTSRGNASELLKARHIVPATLKLPSTPKAEFILPWALVHQLGKHVGFLAGVELDLSKLPAGPEDTDKAHIAHARELQRRFVPFFKLLGTGALSTDEYSAMNEPAAAYQVSIYQLEQLLGGDYHFIEDRVAKEGLEMTCHRRHDGNFGFSEYMTKEQAAHIWDEYNAIPLATPGLTSLAKIAKQAKVDRSLIGRTMKPEEIATVQQMRSLHPVGRVQPHVPNEIAQDMLERYTRIPLAPNRIPINKLNQYLALSYTNTMHRLSDASVVIPKLFLQGMNQKQSCCDWSTVRYLESIGGLRPGVEPIDFDKLPMDVADMASEKIAYAQQVQIRLGLGPSIGVNLLETPELPTNQIMNLEEIPKLGELDPQTRAEIVQMARSTSFTEKAVVRLLVERGLTLGAGCAETGLPILQELRPVPRSHNLEDILRMSEMSTKSALEFLRRYRGNYTTSLDKNGHLALFVEQQSAEMIIRQRNNKSKVKMAPLNWVHAGQILPKVDATLEEFNIWVAQNVRRAEDKDWMMTQNRIVLPHYSLTALTPFILEHTRSNRRGVRPKREENS
jgi:hypothetical protein